MYSSSTACTAFSGPKRIATGVLSPVAHKAKELLDRDPSAQVLIFDDLTSELIELDFRGTPAQVIERLGPTQSASNESPEPDPEVRRPGRPKLGVVAREVTLLPRHWEWLASQPGGASVALRKLVEHGTKTSRSRDSIRRAQEAAYRFMSAMAGNEPQFEEAIRAFFAGERDRFHTFIEPWPSDIRTHTKKLAANAFATA